MHKDFDAWNKLKKCLDAEAGRLFFKQGEIWWVYLGCNIGFELNGKAKDFMRPVIVLKKYNQYSFLALPLSTSKTVNQYRVPVGLVDGKDAVSILSQMRNIDSKRLINKVGYIEARMFSEIKKKASRVNLG